MKNVNLYLWVLLLAVGFTFTSCSVKQEAEEIVEDVTTEKPSGEIVLLKDDYNPGEEIKLAYTLKSDEKKQGWIGIAPSGAAGGQKSGSDANIETKDINNDIGVLTFNAPTEPGDYQISMTTKNGQNEPEELTKVSITVVDPEAETRNISPSIEIEKDTYAPGENIVLNFTAPSTFDKTAWIGLVPSIIERDNERTNYNESIIRKEIAGNTSGKITFTAPDMPGVYNLRMYNSTTNGQEVENVKVIVVK
jgi:hypothetical protein